jgi:transmembrane sensor
MAPENKGNFNPLIYEQAADWWIELREDDVDAGTRERLDAWFRASPEHIRAYLELSAIWEDGADPDLDRTHTADELIARARSASNVISLNSPSDTSPGNTNESSALPTRAGQLLSESLQHPRVRAHRFSWRYALTAAVVVACLAGGTNIYLYSQRHLALTTDTGEQRFVKLVDGSTLELNSRSRVRIRFSDHERDVDLIEGQALFHVIKDPSRPFIVHSGSTLVRAVGTQFDVYRKASGTTVTVVEGRVAVLSPMLEQAVHAASQLGSALPSQIPSSGSTPVHGAGSAAQPPLVSKPLATLPGDRALSNKENAIFLSAGEQITVSAQAAPRPTLTDTAVATAWTQHELVFDSTALSDVAQEFNRYNTRQLIITDAVLRDFHITGVFSSADPASLLKFLRAQRDITVLETDEDVRISKK